MRLRDLSDSDKIDHIACQIGSMGTDDGTSILPNRLVHLFIGDIPFRITRQDRQLYAFFLTLE